MTSGEDPTTAAPCARSKPLCIFTLAGLITLFGVALGAGVLALKAAQDKLLVQSGQAAFQQADLLTHHLSHHIDLAELAKPHVGERINNPGRGLFTNLKSKEAAQIDIFSRHGTVIFSTNPAEVGRNDGSNPDLRKALTGTPVSLVENTGSSRIMPDLRTSGLPATYVPIRTGPGPGGVVGVMAIHQDVPGLVELFGSTGIMAAAITFAGLMIPFMALFFFVRRRSRTIMEYEGRCRTQTEQIETLQRRLAAAHDEMVLKDRMSSVGLLASGVAHEFNNILTAMKGHARLAKINPAHRETFIDLVTKQTERAIQITQGLLSFSVRRGRTLSLCSINELVKDVVKLAGRDLARDNIAVVEQLADALPKVLMNCAEIQQVLLNIVLNAHRAIGSGGTIVITTGREGETVVVDISNNGRHIPEDELPRIFEPFFSRSASGEDEGDGHGLGLSLSYGIIKKHQGSISVRSAAGEGTLFTVHLPIGGADAEMRTAGEQEILFDPMAGTGRRLRILVVDGEAGTRHMVSRIAGRDGHDVDEAADWREAMEMLAGRSYDCILLDHYVLRGCGGEEELKRIKTQHPGARVVVVCGKVLGGDEKGRILEHADALVGKPFDVETIHSVLGSSR